MEIAQFAFVFVIVFAYEVVACRSDSCRYDKEMVD